MISAVVNGIVSLASTFLASNNEIKNAKIEREVQKIKTETKIEEEKFKFAAEFAQNQINNDFSLDNMAIKAMEKDWKDDVFALFFFFILFSAFVPAWTEQVRVGLEVLENMPDFILYGLALIFVHTFGFRGLLKMLLEKKGFLNGRSGNRRI